MQSGGQSRRTQGFTLVELLIVIVVIGVIAAIVIVSFGKLPADARNAARIETASNFRKGLELLTASRGRYNDLLVTHAMFPSACYSSGLPDVNSDGAGDCHLRGGSVLASEVPGFQNAMAAISPIPTGQAYPPIRYSDGTTFYLSPFVYTPTVDGSSQNVIEYELEGNQVDCRLSPIVIYTPPATYTNANPTNQKYSTTEDGGNYTVCIISIAST